MSLWISLLITWRLGQILEIELLTCRKSCTSPHLLQQCLRILSHHQCFQDQPHHVPVIHLPSENEVIYLLTASFIIESSSSHSCLYIRITARSQPWRLCFRGSAAQASFSKSSPGDSVVHLGLKTLPCPPAPSSVLSTAQSLCVLSSRLALTETGFPLALPQQNVSLQPFRGWFSPHLCSSGPEGGLDQLCSIADSNLFFPLTDHKQTSFLRAVRLFHSSPQLVTGICHTALLH